MNIQLLLKTVIRTLAMFALVYAPVISAASYQSHRSIHKAAKSFIQAHVNSQQQQRPVIKSGKLDSRLKLKKCNKSLQAFLPKGSRTLGKTTVGVKCTGSKPWSLHVPLTISLYKKVMVSSRQIQKGTLLTASDIKLIKYDLGKLPYGYFEDPDRLLGMKLTRRAANGTVLTPAMLKKPKIIARGQKVTIMAQSGSMLVRMNGKALSSGAIGDRIKVMNIQSRKKLEGVITLTGEVKVDI